MPHDPALPKLTDTQSIILRAAAQPPENIALPVPNGLAGTAAKMAVSKMIEHGWLQEIDANLRRGEPFWRQTGDGRGSTLVTTEAGRPPWDRVSGRENPGRDPRTCCHGRCPNAT